MKNLHLTLILCLSITTIDAQETTINKSSQLETNKEIARNFYQDLWFTNNTDKYDQYVADQYVVHDIGDRKGKTEDAIEQKHIADFFWKHGNMECEFDYQIAEGDLVATRWTAKDYKAKTLFGRIALDPGKPISIINVFRIKDGKIVEFWNHRHDIDTPQTLQFTLRGFLLGILLSIIPAIWALRLRNKIKVLTA